MKVVVIGGSGLIGSRIVKHLREHGHEAVPASPGSGVDILTGRGLAEALEGADTVIDVSNSPSFADRDVLDFFTTSTAILLEAGAAAGVRHHVALSVVGADRIRDSGYMRAKRAQEQRIEQSSMPHTIVRATQFFECTHAIADAATEVGTVRLAPVLYQPMAADDTARAVARVAVGPSLDAIIEVAGPEPFRMAELVRRWLVEKRDPREVTVDPNARYFGAALAERTLLPDAGARLGGIRFEDWLRASLEVGGTAPRQ